MGKPKGQTKSKICISVNAELLKWIDKQVQNRVFSSRSHGFEAAIHRLKKH